MAVTRVAGAGTLRLPQARFAIFLLGVLAALFAGPARSQEEEVAEPFPIAVDEPARVVRVVAPLYPEAARREGVAGIVIVGARVGRDGRVRETRIVNSVPALDVAAARVVQRYEFAPAILENREVETWVHVPVRFDESLPSGTRGSEPVDARRYSDLERSFESEVEVLRQIDPAAPIAETVAQHEAVMRASLLLEAIPDPGAAAIHALLRGDTLARSPVPAKKEGRKEAWREATRLAPWWPLPYRRLAGTAIAQRDFDAARAWVRVLLAGRPNDPEATGMVVRIRQLELASARSRRNR